MAIAIDGRGRVPGVVVRHEDDRLAGGVGLGDRALAAEQLELRRRERPSPRRVTDRVLDLDRHRGVDLRDDRAGVVRHRDRQGERRRRPGRSRS